ncbi:hypothetical protein D6C80_07970 [Aureobasidium pullulans]|nr:hypothetical protein D6C80_07970 [Aureobasidium pullulans]
MYDRLHDISDASRGTCAWVLQDTTLRSWRYNQSGLLWIKGRPGAGKSTIMKYALTSLIQTQSRKNHLVASFFCHGRGVDLQKTPSGIFRALLHQILVQTPKLGQSFEKAFQARCDVQGHHGVKWEWTESELRTLLKEHILTLYQDTEVFLFVDALDECGEKSARELLDLFRSITSTSKMQYKPILRICVSSRHYPLIGFGVSYVIMDIRSYAAQMLGSRCRDGRELNQLLSIVASRSGGIFQWTVLIVARIMKALERQHTLDSIIQDIDETPRELYPLYRQIVHSHVQNTSINALEKETFRYLCQWVSLARRPLTLRELRCAISMSFSIRDDSRRKRSRLDAHDANWREEIQHLSYGLLSINRRSGSEARRQVLDDTVQFVHQSVQEYFVNGGGVADLGPSLLETAEQSTELQMVKICYASILSHRSEKHSHERRHPLFHYSLQYIFSHARDVGNGPDEQSDLLRILDWPQSNCIAKILGTMPSRYKHRQRPEHLSVYTTKIAAAFNLPDLVEIILRRSSNLSVNLIQAGKSALHLAAESGSCSVVERLLAIEQTCDREPILQMDTRDCDGYTPLMLAASKGHHTVVERLLNTRRVDINAKSGGNVLIPVGLLPPIYMKHTSLHAAIRGGHVFTAKVLMQYGAEVGVRDDKDDTPLTTVLNSGLQSRNEDMFKLFWRMLIPAAKDLYLANIKGFSPLCTALSSNRSLYFVNGFFYKGILPDTRDTRSRTWLHCLLRSDPLDFEALELLLAHPKFDPNPKDPHDELPLLELSRLFVLPPHTLKLLLRNTRLDIGRRDEKGHTALMLAARGGSSDTIQILLADGRILSTAVDSDGKCAVVHATDRKENAMDYLRFGQFRSVPDSRATYIINHWSHRVRKADVMSYWADELKEATLIVALLKANA